MVKSTAVFSRKKRVGPNLVMEYILLFIGSFIMACSFNLFLLPNQIASGGVSGISVVLQSFGIEPAFTQWMFNIPLYILGVWLLGKQLGIKAAVGSLIFPFFVFLSSHFPLLQIIHFWRAYMVEWESVSASASFSLEEAQQGDWR